MNDELTPAQLNLLGSYARGPRVWDAASILPGVHALAGKGLIEPCGDNGAHRLTDAGRAALSPPRPGPPEPELQ